MTSPATQSKGLKRFLPRIGSPAYHFMLALVALSILGPLGGISAAFMNFSIGFFVGGQVLAGILGSTVTLPYGPEGKHGGNYMQTMAASVAGMCAMSVLIQAMVWLGLPQPAAWKLVLYYLCIGMFGVGVGMLYTPLLVDRMQLMYPSGFAVANILRALTDKNLLKRSISKLGGGIAGGFMVGIVALKSILLKNLGWGEGAIGRWDSLGLTGFSLDKLSISAGTFGAGMICGARIAIPALVVALVGWELTPYLRSIGWLGERESFRRVGFLISLGTILGAALLDITLILSQAIKRYRQKAAERVQPAEDWKRVNMVKLVFWILFWAAGIIGVGHLLLGQPVKFLVIAVLLSFVFVLINGISQGISDWNPISSAFVVTVFILVWFGLRDPGIGLMCASVLLIACSEGGDMQQDRSTGWRLGTNRVVQFRYQVIGIAMGAVLAVAVARLFLTAYPALNVNQIDHPDAPGVDQWQSAMTLKFAGSLRGITAHKPHVIKAIELGIVLGLVMDSVRKLIKSSARYQQFVKSSRTGYATDFALDAVILPSPYASSFGGFVELSAVWWWTAGGVFSSAYETIRNKLKPARSTSSAGEVPADMSTMSLVGGGLIAGDSLAALAIGIHGLLQKIL